MTAAIGSLARFGGLAVLWPLVAAGCGEGAPRPAPSALLSSAPAGGCDPNYAPCVPVDADVDCAGGEGNGPSYVAGPVTVLGDDPYELDRNGDGVGCEH